MSVVTAAVVATVAFSGDASAQAHTLTTTAYLTYPLPAHAVSAKTAPQADVGRGLIVKLEVGRNARYWFVMVQAAPEGPYATPQCWFTSTNSALIFAFHQHILENLGRAMRLDCSDVTRPSPRSIDLSTLTHLYGPPSAPQAITMIDLDAASYYTMDLE